MTEPKRWTIFKRRGESARTLARPALVNPSSRLLISTGSATNGTR